MAMYKCKNFGSCSRADLGEEFLVAAGTDDKCPECSSTLVRVGDESADVGKRGGDGSNKARVIASAAAAVLLVLAGVGYMKWGGKQVVELKAESSPAAAPLQVPAVAASIPSAPPAGASESAVVVRPAAMVSQEVAARTTCDEATKAKQRDADKVCRRATAVTLMNSGVLSAIGGRLDEAEKDYMAAKEKDPDFPELYFNLAVLKARQNKGSEAVDNLTLASAKGFTQFSAIKGEPALQKLKSDPALKLKIDAFEAK